VFICVHLWFLKMSDWIEQRPEGVLLRVRVKPRAKKNEIQGPTPDGNLAVRVTAPPVDNKANAALITLLAKKLRLPKSRISIHSGEKSRNKTLMVNDAAREKILTQIMRH
jgi:uncharacterized protein (TIGR00251 family)